MELESPADAWYVWLGVAVASVAIAGVALSLPTGPPPNANEAANAIDRVAASTHDASASHDHDADEIRVDATRISMRNEHGTTHATLAYGDLVPVTGEERLENVTYGSSVESEFVDAEAPVRAMNASRENLGGEWLPADGPLTVRAVSWDGAHGGGGGTLRTERDREAEADDHTWLEYDRAEDTFHATIVVA